MSNSESEFLKTARPLAEALLEYAQTEGQKYGITDAKISVNAAAKQQTTVERGRVENMVFGGVSDVSVTLYAGDRALSFRRDGMDEAGLKEAMLKNMQVINLVPANPNNRLLEADKVCHAPDENLDLADPNPPDAKALSDYAIAFEAAARGEPGIKSARSVSITKKDTNSLVLATNGIDRHESGTVYSASAEVIATDGKSMEVDGDYSVARHFSDMTDPTELGKSSAQAALSKLGATLPATGDMPIVLDHAAAESFFSAIYSAIGGTALARGTTFFKDKLGQQVMSSEVTLVDDPGVPRGLGSGQTDAAGQEASKVTFVENGVLKSFNISLSESRMLGMAATGRDGTGGGPTNGRVLPGAKTPDELIADIKEGIYINGFNGGTVDINNGQHSRQAYGKLIKDGKITDISVSGFVVSGNLKDMFMNVAVANDTPPQPNTRYQLAAPTTRINGVTIAGK